MSGADWGFAKSEPQVPFDFAQDDSAELCGDEEAAVAHDLFRS